MEEGKKNRNKNKGLGASFITGAIALVFLIIGYQVALFVHKAAALRIVANQDHPDTVYVIDPKLAAELLSGSGDAGGDTHERAVGYAPFSAKNKADATKGEYPTGSIVRKNSNHSSQAKAVKEKVAPRKVESFKFNPNTASLEDLMRLGFSEKQAQAIDNYRQKGGRFRRSSDFAKSYVVADTVYERLKPYIDIPKLDINTADSTALLDLPGIGPYFAGKVVQYRGLLGGYSCKEQLMEIYHFDKEKFDALQDLITCSEPQPFALWTLPEANLSRHPHISKAEAHGIVIYRNHNKPEDCTLEALLKAGVLSEEHASRLKLCLIAPTAASSSPE